METRLSSPHDSEDYLDNVDWKYRLSQWV